MFTLFYVKSAWADDACLTYSLEDSYTFSLLIHLAATFHVILSRARGEETLVFLYSTGIPLQEFQNLEKYKECVESPPVLSQHSTHQHIFSLSPFAYYFDFKQPSLKINHEAITCNLSSLGLGQRSCGPRDFPWGRESPSTRGLLRVAHWLRGLYSRPSWVSQDSCQGRHPRLRLHQRRL